MSRQRRRSYQAEEEMVQQFTTVYTVREDFNSTQYHEHSDILDNFMFFLGLKRGSTYIDGNECRDGYPLLDVFRTLVEFLAESTNIRSSLKS